MSGYFLTQDYPGLHLTSETLTWDPMTNLYEQQENAMMDYSGKIVCNAAMRGQVPTLIVNQLQLMTTDMADMMCLKAYLQYLVFWDI